MNKFNILKIICMWIALTSCRDTAFKENQAVELIRGDLEINFTDMGVDSVIAEYVKKNNVDPKDRVLSLSIYRDPGKSIYYLTQIRRKALVEGKIPDYLFLHNNQFL